MTPPQKKWAAANMRQSAQNMFSLLDASGSLKSSYRNFLLPLNNQVNLTRTIKDFIDSLFSEPLSAMELIATRSVCNMIIHDAEKIHPDANFDILPILIYLNHKEQILLKYHWDLDFDSKNLYNLLRKKLHDFMDPELE
jgi:hypothetical protein